MSGTRVRTIARGPGVVAVPVLLGIGALLLRLWILQTASGVRTLLLTSVYGTILVAGLLVPVPRDRARLDPRLTLALGLCAVGLAAVAAGRPVAASVGVAALVLSVLAAVAEEALFRRAVYGWLERWGPVAAIFGSALLFAAIHIPLYGMAAFPVDLGAGLLFSWQRWAAGTWTVPAATHAAANLLAVVMR